MYDKEPKIAISFKTFPFKAIQKIVTERVRKFIQKISYGYYRRGNI
jgi:hypothetical protein